MFTVFKILLQKVAQTQHINRFHGIDPMYHRMLLYSKSMFLLSFMKICNNPLDPPPPHTAFKSMAFVSDP